MEQEIKEGIKPLNDQEERLIVEMRADGIKDGEILKMLSLNRKVSNRKAIDRRKKGKRVFK